MQTYKSRVRRVAGAFIRGRQCEKELHVQILIDSDTEEHFSDHILLEDNVPEIKAKKEAPDIGGKEPNIIIATKVREAIWSLKQERYRIVSWAGLNKRVGCFMFKKDPCMKIQPEGA